MMAALPERETPAGSLHPVDGDADNVMSNMFWFDPGVEGISVPLKLQSLSVPPTVPSVPTANDAFDVAHVPTTLACVTLNAFSAL